MTEETLCPVCGEEAEWIACHFCSGDDCAACDYAGGHYECFAGCVVEL